MIIAIEGVDGSGKSTILQSIKPRFGSEVLWTREPYKLAADFINAGPSEMSVRQRCDRFIEDRRQHLTEIIEPAIRAGKVVVTDRYITSTVVYQGLEMFNASIDLGSPWDHDYTIYLRNRMRFMPRPRLEIFIDVDPRQAVENCVRKGEKLDILRAVDLRRLYMLEYGSIFWPKTIVDGNRPIEDVAEDVFAVIQEAVWSRPSGE
jgi:dTMP kinase